MGCLLGYVLKGFYTVRYSFQHQIVSLSNEVQLLFPGLLGLYSGIFAMFLKCQLNKSTGRRLTIVFYALCLLYILSTFTIVCDLVVVILQLEVSHISISKMSFLIRYEAWYFKYYIFNSASGQSE